MLCFYQKNKLGEICTNRCPDRPKCNIQKSAFLIDAIDNLSSEFSLEDDKGVTVTYLLPYCTAVEGYINGSVYDYQQAPSQN